MNDEPSRPGIVIGAPPSRRKGYNSASSMTSSEKFLQVDSSAEVKRLSSPDAEHPVTLIDTDLIDVKRQVRRHFDPEKLDALRLSIQEDGIRDAVMVRPTGNGRYHLVFGERRLQAAKLVRLTQIPAVIRELDDKRAKELQIQENQLHEQLSPIEQAEAGIELLTNHWNVSADEVRSRLMAYQRYPDDHAAEIAALEPYWSRNMGVTWLTFTIKRLPLTKLPEPIKDGLFAHRYSEAQAKALARLSPETQADLLARLPLPDLAELNAMGTPTPQKKTLEPRALLKPAHSRALASLEGEQAKEAEALLRRLAELLS